VSLHEKLRQTHQNKKRSKNKISDERVGKQKLSRFAHKNTQKLQQWLVRMIHA
jgi:hypothetical protein